MKKKKKNNNKNNPEHAGVIKGRHNKNKLAPDDFFIYFGHEEPKLKYEDKHGVL